MGGEQQRYELSVPQILGSALAAVTAAVAASYLGVAGTVIGAAVVSVASTVGTAIYTHYLQRTGERVRRKAVPVVRPPDGTGAREGGSTLVMPAVELPRRRLAWGKVAVAAGVVFAVSMGSILTYQAAAQQTVHEQVTGRTPHHKDPDGGKQAPAVERTAPETGGSRDATPGPAPSPTPSSTPQPATRTPKPTPTVTATVTVTPRPTGGPGTSAPAPSEPAPSEPAQDQPDPDDQATGDDAAQAPSRAPGPDSRW
ncbi:hypothetical protein MF672_027820 [Actinomadura sp. ATCC 31491]|uniref:Uncharacterized protein n=1 Tax=Actinomadura luzonensis TaxID=2805427 RepID=A0ABT0FZ00_9ACTN|nr:hypothetical protein [Actinomadura luzonensis]MCK2217572.1 hypothetical protein [Actinomadura luzonensis]